MKNSMKYILALIVLLTGTSLFAQNVSTGIDNSGNSVGIGNPDPNWVITAGPITGPSYMVSPYPVLWQSTPVSGTNSGWINSNGTLWTVPGYYTLERAFEVAPGECSFVTNFSVTYDDDLTLLELVPPTGPAISLEIPSAPSYQLSAPVVVSVPSPVAGTWKIRAVNHLVDELGAFILSGSISHFSASSCLKNKFTGVINGCQGSFTGNVGLPSCMQLIGSSWTVDGTYAGSGNNLNYTFSGNGTYTVCFTTQAITAQRNDQRYDDLLHV